MEMERRRRIMIFHRNLESDRFLERIRGFLLEGMDPNTRNRFGDAPLHTAAESREDNITIIRELIAAGADVNLKSRRGFSPLHDAVIFRKRQMVEILLESGANINAETKFCGTALHFAVDNKKPESIHRLSDYAGINYEPDLTIIYMLLRCENINVNARDFSFETPLHWAAADGRKSIVKALLAKGANPNKLNNWDDTPLHKLLHGPSWPDLIDIAKLLIQHGARLCILNGDRKTPIDRLIDGLGYFHSGRVCKDFVKLVTFHRNVNENVIRSIERNAELGSFRLICCAEVDMMKTQIISGQLTTHDFVLGCFNMDQFYGVYDNPYLVIYKTVVDILLSGVYTAYIYDIFVQIPKRQLWKVLTYNFSLKNKRENFRNFHNIQFLQLCINSSRSFPNYVSHKDLFDLILSASNLTEDQINALRPN